MPSTVSKIAKAALNEAGTQSTPLLYQFLSRFVRRGKLWTERWLDHSR